VTGEFRSDMEKMRGKKVTGSHAVEWSELTYSEIISEQNPQRRRGTEAGLCFQLEVQGTDSTTQQPSSPATSALAKLCSTKTVWDHLTLDWR